MHSPAHQLVPTMHVYRFTVGCDNILDCLFNSVIDAKSHEEDSGHWT